MLGALSRGETVIENFLAGKDCLATIDCFRKLGVDIKMPATGAVRVSGRELYGLSEPEDVLDAGNSGTTIRLLLGILSGQSFFSVITGDRSLRRRPMARVTGPLGLMGARIEGRRDGNLAPLSVRGGRLKPVTYISEVASAQVKSAVLLAGLFADGETVFTEPYGSRDHTERMLRQFGAEVDVSGCTVRVKGQPGLTGQKVNVPGDISSAAFLMAAAAALPGSDLTLKGVGINPARDGIIEVLSEMGAGIRLFNRRQEGAEPVADIRVCNNKKLSGVSVGGKIIPRLIDDIPALAVAAATAEGKTEIRDAGELKVKESNRIYTVNNLLTGFGAGVEELTDGLLVRGGRTLKGCHCKSHGDHRIAMAAVVAGLLAGGETTVIDTSCIDISFPGFYDVLNNIRVE
ncbi:MAG: 3-phosphoshikimate 1-carboxyvinyltransferase, partial [Pelotomaculum thermopropionicum]